MHGTPSATVLQTTLRKRIKGYRLRAKIKMAATDTAWGYSRGITKGKLRTLKVGHW